MAKSDEQSKKQTGPQSTSGTTPKKAGNPNQPVRIKKVGTTVTTPNASNSAFNGSIFVTSATATSVKIMAFKNHSEYGPYEAIGRVGDVWEFDSAFMNPGEDYKYTIVAIATKVSDVGSHVRISCWKEM